jgi:hypothetical protein
MNEQTRTEQIEALIKDTELEGLDIPDADSADELIEALEEQINETEVIYYSNAMKYLAENDASLSASLELAADMGYTPDKLNSEILATILQRDNMLEELEKYRSEIEEIYDTNEIE